MSSLNLTKELKVLEEKDGSLSRELNATDIPYVHVFGPRRPRTTRRRRRRRRSVLVRRRWRRWWWWRGCLYS